MFRPGKTAFPLPTRQGLTFSCEQDAQLRQPVYACLRPRGPVGYPSYLLAQDQQDLSYGGRIEIICRKLSLQGEIGRAHV